MKRCQKARQNLGCCDCVQTTSRVEQALEGSSVEAQTLAQGLVDMKKLLILLKQKMYRRQVNTWLSDACCSPAVAAHARKQTHGLYAQNLLSFNCAGILVQLCESCRSSSTRVTQIPIL